VAKEDSVDKIIERSRNYRLEKLADKFRENIKFASHLQYNRRSISAIAGFKSNFLPELEL